ncbi:hypothetical protein AABB24_001102 [Solanum stoloniferum]|uniref:Uncharacterized protein n=1 Tax=Solanum stoloniferum TaxID=62892 RepID=A0ABD2VI99_9SOLN
MEKPTDSSLFVNDGSFMERFKQLQQEKEKEKLKGASSKESKTTSSILGASTPKAVISKPSLEFKANSSRKTATVASGGKLAFSLKQKSKIPAPSVKLGEDEDDEDEKDAGNSSGDGPIKRQRVEEPRALHKPLRQIDVAYILSPYQHWGKEMFNERFGKCGYKSNLYSLVHALGINQCFK